MVSFLFDIVVGEYFNTCMLAIQLRHECFSLDLNSLGLLVLQI